MILYVSSLQPYSTRYIRYAVSRVLCAGLSYEASYVYMCVKILQ
jgi:hypothetical protein